MSLVGRCAEEKIWNFFKSKGLNDFGVAGLMGNLYAESGLSPQNLQNSYEHSLGYTDNEYCNAVDNGSYKNFVYDSAGFGLAQWTFWSLKQDLLNFARCSDRSIGDLEMQLEFLNKELTTDFRSILNVLKTANSIKDASNCFLFNFENPANQGASVQNLRASYGQKYYDKYASKNDNGGNKDMAVQNFTNSSLVAYTRISPNKTVNRNHIIDTITIHCVVGQCSVETLGRIFSDPSKQASANYAIGYDGKVGMYVEEKDRSWCSSSSSNDSRAITIEVASDTTHPYAVRDVAMRSLITLVADVCKRNNIKELKWEADKSLIGQIDKQNMTVHRWFANKACPGDYLYNRHGYIANEVNKRLGVDNENPSPIYPVTPPVNSDLSVGDKVRLKAGATYVSGQAIPSWVFQSVLYLREIRGKNAVISTQKTGAVTGVVLLSNLIRVDSDGENSFKPYTIKVSTSVLNIRSGAGTNYPVVGSIRNGGVYTIVEERSGNGASKWGKLKSGAGWISLDYCKRIK